MEQWTRFRQFVTATWSELKKTSWPSKKEPSSSLSMGGEKDEEKARVDKDFHQCTTSKLLILFPVKEIENQVINEIQFNLTCTRSGTPE